MLDLEAEDPLASHRPPDASCDPSSIAVEYEGVEISTADCSYAQLIQPARVDVVAGQTARIVAWHQDLVAEEDAEAHIAVLAGSTVIWEKEVEIPSLAQSWDEELVFTDDVGVGERLTLHLHNHGSNTWTLLSISLNP